LDTTPPHLEALLASLEERLQYRFRNRQLLVNALLHRSYVHEHPDLHVSDNERLEFLGDAALDLAVSHLLIHRFPHYQEGELSRLRAELVNERQLAVLAEGLSLGEALHLGRGEERSGGRQKSSLLADAYEALLAAVYLDGGLDPLLAVVARHFAQILAEDEEAFSNKDAKTRLQELVQARDKVTPHYRLEGEEGPDHSKVFQVSVWVNDRLLAYGFGPTKKAAQRQAAERGLDILEAEWRKVET
jgi:ribonuclease-3